MKKKKFTRNVEQRKPSFNVKRGLSGRLALALGVSSLAVLGLASCERIADAGNTGSDAVATPLSAGVTTYPEEIEFDSSFSSSSVGTSSTAGLMYSDSNPVQLSSSDDPSSSGKSSSANETNPASSGGDQYSSAVEPSSATIVGPVVINPPIINPPVILGGVVAYEPEVEDTPPNAASED
jgi:hypothetical protein